MSGVDTKIARDIALSLEDKWPVHAPLLLWIGRINVVHVFIILVKKQHTTIQRACWI